MCSPYVFALHSGPTQAQGSASAAVDNNVALACSKILKVAPHAEARAMATASGLTSQRRCC